MLSLICALLIHLAHADEQRWQEEHPNTLQIKGGLVFPGLDFQLTGPGDADITFVPNTPTNPMIGFGYKNIGLSVQIPTAPDPDSVTQKGKTRIHDYQLRFFGHRSTHELIYQRFKGYSLENWRTPQAQPVIRPDLSVRVVGVNFIRSLSPRFFSDAVAYDQRGVQFRQGGAIFLWSSVGETRIEGGEPLVPSFALNGRNRIADLEKIRIYHALLGIGYGHQFPIFSRGYFVASLFLGGGMNYQEVEINSRTDSAWTESHRVGLRSGLGYNFGDYTAGVQLIVDSTTSSVLDGSIQASTFTGRFFFGYRFQGVSISWLDF